MSQAQGTKKILLCDDDETFVDILETLLRGEGFTVITASSGFAGLEKLMEENPDLLLLDLDMPSGTGFELMETISRNKAFDPSRIIVLSGYENQADQERLRAMGVSDYVVKPLNCKVLLAQVRDLLGERLKENGAH